MGQLLCLEPRDAIEKIIVDARCVQSSSFASPMFVLSSLREDAQRSARTTAARAMIKKT
ncbi:MAG: hypothetical protein K2Y27_08760 [Xanthobacteraceae bacterium]|nr:hypothetical protein [Xanthobacteraceae bacterium]